MATREMEQGDRRTEERQQAPVESVEDVQALVADLNDAFAVELDRRRAAATGRSPLADPDGGQRFFGGLLLAATIGALTWSGIIGLVVLVA